MRANYQCWAAKRFQLSTLAIRSQEECGAILGISRARVRQIERTALRKVTRALLPLWRELKEL